MHNLIIAVALSLSATNDYLYTTPQTTNIIGVGIGPKADYRAVRAEDNAFLGESFSERGAGTGFIGEFNPSIYSLGPSTNLMTAGYGSLIPDLYAPTFLDRFWSLLWPDASIVPLESEFPKGKITFYPATTNADFIVFYPSTNSPLNSFTSPTNFAFKTNSIPATNWLSGALKIGTITNLYRLIRKDDAVLGRDVDRFSRKFLCKNEETTSVDGYKYIDEFSYAEGSYTDQYGDEIKYDYVNGYTLSDHLLGGYTFTDTNKYSSLPFIYLVKINTKRAIVSSTKTFRGGKFYYNPSLIGMFDVLPEGNESGTPVIDGSDENQVDGIFFTHPSLSTNAVPDIEMIKSVQVFCIYALQATERDEIHDETITTTNSVIENIIAAAPAEAIYSETKNAQHWYIAKVEPVATLKALWKKYATIRDFEAPDPIVPKGETTEEPRQIYESTRYVRRQLSITHVFLYPLIKRSWRTYCKE